MLANDVKLGRFGNPFGNVRIDFCGWDVAVFFEKLARNRGEVTSKIFVVPKVFFGVLFES